MSVAKIDRLDKDNYQTWKLQMEAVLVKNDAIGYVNGKIPKPDEKANPQELADWEVGDMKAKADLILAISASELSQITGCETSREVWLKLQSTYQSKGAARKATLLKHLLNTRMNDEDDVRGHMTDFFDTVERLKTMEVEIHQDLLAVMLLNSLPDSYENFKCAIETRDDFPSVDQLKIKILEQNDSRKERSKASANALMAKKKIQPKRSTEEKPPNSKPFRFKCNFCQKKGHKSSDCDKKKSHYARNTEESQLAFREQALNVSLPKWCIDSGCTSHMCNEAGRFSSLDTSDHTRVNLANNDSTDVNGKGTVKMCVSVNGKKQVMSLHNTLHVPELRSNLLSVGKITDQGLTVTFTSTSAEIKNRSGETLMRAKRTNGLYLVDEVSGSSNSKEEISLKCESKIENWHQRFGHLNESDLKSLQAGKKVKGIDLRSNEKLSDCTICLQGKMTQTPFPKKSSRTSQKLDLIHMDLCGPMRVQSKGGAKYFLTLIDDYSRWCEIRFLKKKSDVFAEFKKFKNLVETQKGRKIKCIQSDNGKEFCNREFDRYLEENGISRRLTVNHTPQQNGIAERKNRSLVETARCMLIQSKLAPSFWAEAISTANHIKNRSPSSPINGDTPFKLWNNRIPNVSYFRIFGSTVYFLDKTPQKNKFDPRSKRGTFIGYSDQTKGYRIWLSESKEVIVSRDVKFLNSFSEQNEFEDFISKEIFETEEKTKTIKDNNTTSWTFPDKSQPKNQDCQEPIAFENADQEQGLIDDEQNINDENIDEEDVVIEENLTETIPETNIPIRGRGRPKLVRTGMRGRPRKQYCTKPAESALPDPEDNSILGPEPDFEELAGIADISVKKALAGPDSKGWQEAIKSEISSILENRTFKVVRRPENKNVVGCRFTLKEKLKADGTVERKKARLVAKGYSQRQGEDFNETFAPVVRMSSIRTVMALAVEHDMEIHQLDVVTAFLNGELDEDIYMQVPNELRPTLEDIVKDTNSPKEIKIEAKKMLKTLREDDHAVCKLEKALYGLKQASRQWNKKLDVQLKRIGLQQLSSDPCIYHMWKNGKLLILAIYVDDLWIASADPEWIEEIKVRLMESFKMKYL
ncbi:unnamed protein product, partial [Nesidiocoris tenuis]